MANTFAGLSSLRAKEAKDTGPKPPSEQAQRFQDYLAQQYGAGPGDAAGKPKKKKKVKREQAAGTMRIVDNDVTGFATMPDPHRRHQDDEDEGKFFFKSPSQLFTPISVKTFICTFQINFPLILVLL